MMDISGHYRSYRDESGFENDSVPLLINCCGFQSFATKNYTVSRINGRKDYQIIYIQKGSGSFFIDQKWQVITQNSIVLYRPSEPQIYKYEYRNHPEVFWLHFTGSSCEKILSDFCIQTGFIGESTQFKIIFQEIILELQLKKTCFEQIVCGSFLRLLGNMKRTKLQTINHQETNFEIDRLIIHLNQNYMKSWSIKDMADFCKMSVDYFAHLFKKVTGHAPLLFLTIIRMEKAKELLLLENSNVTEVAYLLGYTDPLYFSRVFKKYTTFSPVNYVKHALSIQTPFSTN